MSFVSHTGLAAALRAVFGARDSRRMAREWEIIVAALKQHARMRRTGDHAAEVVQLAVVKLLRARWPFEGEADPAAFAYLGTIVRREYLGIVDRTRRRDPLDFAVSPGGNDEYDPIERLAAPELDATRGDDAPAALQEAIDRLRGHVDQVIEEAGLAALRREGEWLHANATILAVLAKAGARAIAEALGVPGVSDAAIYKWTERGRPWVERALDRWEGEILDGEDDGERAVTAELRAQVTKRRGDAGRARPARRKKESGRHGRERSK
jgi:DNA-directed RNA polymerase specialized sigma24 family protein